MTGDSRSFALDISEPLFRLTTESVRLHSNETRCHGTLGSLVNDWISADDPLGDRSPQTIRDHLSAIPTNGDIRINLTITKSSADNLAEVKERFGKSLGSSLSIGDTLSILLFHYVADQGTSRVLKRLGLDTLKTTARTAKDREKTTGNVVQFK